MDLRATPAEAALRDEVRGWLRANLPWEYGKGLPPRFDDLAEEVAFGRAWQAKLASGRLVGVAWPQRVRRARRRSGRALHRHRGARPGPRAGARRPHRREPRRPHAARARHRRSRRRAGCPASSTRPRSGASCSASPAPAATSPRSRPAPRRSTAASSSTGRRSGRATRSSPTGAGAWRAPIPTRRRAKASPRSSIDMHAPGVEVRPLRQITDESEFNEVFFSDVFVPDDRLVGPLHEGWRVANSTLTHERGVNPRQLVAHSQLLDELWKLGLERDALDDPRLGRPARAGVRRGPHLPAAQLAFDLAHREGRRARPGRQHQQALVERDEQAPARHRDGGGRARATALAGRRRTIPATARGSVRGSTTRRARSGPAPTRSSATSSASARSAFPARRTEPRAPSAPYYPPCNDASSPSSPSPPSPSVSPPAGAAARARRVAPGDPTSSTAQITIDSSASRSTRRPVKAGSTVTVKNDSSATAHRHGRRRAGGFNVTIDAGKTATFTAPADGRNVQVPLQHSQLHARHVDRQLRRLTPTVPTPVSS